MGGLNNLSTLHAVFVVHAVLVVFICIPLLKGMKYLKDSSLRRIKLMNWSTASNRGLKLTSVAEICRVYPGFKSESILGKILQKDC